MKIVCGTLLLALAPFTADECNAQTHSLMGGPVIQSVNPAQGLVAAVFPEDVVKRRALANFETVLQQQLSKDPIYAAREARFPGIHAEGIRAGGQAFSVIIDKIYRQVADAMANGFAASLTAAELAPAQAFFGSVTGQKVLALKRASFDVRATAARLAQKKSPAINMTDVNRTDEAWRRQLSESEAAELDRYARSPVAGKIDSIVTSAQEEYVRRFNADLASNSAMIDKAVTDAINGYMSRSRGRPG